MREQAGALTGGGHDRRHPVPVDDESRLTGPRRGQAWARQGWTTPEADRVQRRRCADPTGSMFARSALLHQARRYYERPEARRRVEVKDPA